MRRVLVALSLLIVMSLPVLASCDEEDIDTVAKDGEIIVLTDGSAWRSDNPATSSTWLSADSVLVCNDTEMINKDEDGERVGITKTSYSPDEEDDDDDNDPHAFSVGTPSSTTAVEHVRSVVAQQTKA